MVGRSFGYCSSALVFGRIENTPDKNCPIPHVIELLEATTKPLIDSNEEG